MKALVIGASAGLGRSISNSLARLGYDLVLVSSDQNDLMARATDLSLRYEINTSYQVINLENSTEVNNILPELRHQLSDLNALFIVAGLGYPKEDCGSIKINTIDELVNVNFLSLVKIINVCLPFMEDRSANIVGIGSVASTRPRRNNSLYGTSKKALEFYFGTLRHYLTYKPCRIQFYKLGYMQTRLIDNMKLYLPIANPEAVADIIVRNLGRDIESEYLPKWWWLPMSILKVLPWPVYRRLSI